MQLSCSDLLNYDFDNIAKKTDSNLDTASRQTCKDLLQ